MKAEDIKTGKWYWVTIARRFNDVYKMECIQRVDDRRFIFEHAECSRAVYCHELVVAEVIEKLLPRAWWQFWK